MRSGAGKIVENNTVFIRKKFEMNHMHAYISLFHGGANEICIGTRGRPNTRAVDIAEVT